MNFSIKLNNTFIKLVKLCAFILKNRHPKLTWDVETVHFEHKFFIN